MSALAKGGRCPNLFLARPDGTGLELYDLWKKEHCLLLLLPSADKDVLAFIGRWQDQARLFEWLNTRLICAFPRREAVPTPWPAPGYPPCLHAQALPSGLEWGKGYVVSKNRSLIEVYPEPAMLSAAKVEKDLLYWEANHCMV